MRKESQRGGWSWDEMGDGWKRDVNTDGERERRREERRDRNGD